MPIFTKGRFFDMTIRTKEDLRTAYGILTLIEESVEQCRREGHEVNREKVAKVADGIKRDIRTYYHNDYSDRKYICGDFDSALFLIRLPQGISDPVAYFEENEYLHCIPSQYDCTGQAFTVYYKICKRGGRYYAYHRIGYDY